MSDGTIQTVRYSVSSLGEIVVAADTTLDGCGGNCFDAAPTGVRVEDHHTGFSRTVIEFTTGCISLTPDQSVAPIDNAFATCARCPGDGTNFDFDMRLTECTGSGGDTRCSLREDKRSVTVAMNHVEEPATIQWAIDNQKKVAFQVDFRHEREYDEAGFDGDGIARNTSIGPDEAAYYYETREEIDAWRSRSTLGVDLVTGAFHVVQDDVLAISLGFEQGTAAEEVMVGSLQEVHMGRFKAQCHHPAFTGSVLQQSIGGVECTRTNMIGPGSTHSPFAFVGSGSPKCITFPQSCQFVTNSFISEFPKLTLWKETWEIFLEAVYDSHMDGRSQGPTGGLNALFEGAELTMTEFMGTTPIFESQHLVDGGVVTDLALGLYGSCEPNRVSGPEITAGGEPLKLFFPGQNPERSGYGVCTCKGMMAYNFEEISPLSGDVLHPYRDTRQVVYSQDMYDADPANLANLHKCPQFNYHQSGDGKVLPSWDQFYFDARTLLATEEYFFHLELELSDPEVFGASPQAGSRRMQSISTSSLFNLGIGSTGARVLSERSADSQYTSQGAGSIIIVEDAGSSASSSGDTAKDASQIILFVLFFGLLVLWLYPLLLQPIYANTRMFGYLCTPIVRTIMIFLAGFSLYFAPNDLLWCYQLTAFLVLLVWCGLPFYYHYFGTIWAHGLIGCPVDATDKDEIRSTMYCIQGIHVSILVVFLLMLIVTDTHVFDLGLASSWCACIFGSIYILVFPTRYMLLLCKYRRDPEKLNRLLKGCDGIVMDGFGFMSCHTERTCTTSSNSVPVGLICGSKSQFQCSVDKVVADIKGTESMQTYGIVRRPQFRI